MSTSTLSKLTVQLHEIAFSEDDTIRQSVAKAALEYEDPAAFFHDLFRHGCISGMVSGLVYYTDTRAFFDHHYAEIEELRLEAEENLGESLQIKGELKNFFAWFAFEETAVKLADELGLEP